MTVKEMVRELLTYPQDMKVVDTWGVPIMYSVNKGDAIYFEPKDQIDLDQYLDGYFSTVLEYNMSDADTVLELNEMGITLTDLKNYKEDTYNWAIKTIEENGLEL